MGFARSHRSSCPSAFLLGVVVLLVISERACADTFYEILGVQTSATSAEIKKAYRSLARKLHPDKHPASEKKIFEEKFIAVVNAYEILSDDSKRREYDESGVQDANEYDEYERHDNFGEAWKAYEGHSVEDTPQNWLLLFSIVVLPLSWVMWQHINSSMSKAREKAAQKAAVAEAAAIASGAKKAKEPTRDEIDALERRRREREIERARLKEEKRRLREERRLEEEAAKGDIIDAEVPTSILRKAEAARQWEKIEANTQAGTSRKTRSVLKDNTPWSNEEIARLLKGVKKYPSGTVDRWERVLDFLGSRTRSAMMQKLKAIKEMKAPRSASSEPSHSAPKTRPWDAREQQKLEEAMRAHNQATYSTKKERWDAIASFVGTRSRGECVARYKECRQMIKRQEGGEHAEAL